MTIEINQDILQEVNKKKHFNILANRVLDEFFKTVNERLASSDKIEYTIEPDSLCIGDGYVLGEFIKIDKCPDWVFGVSLYNAKLYAGNYIQLDMQVWCQFEPTLNKFRYSYANYRINEPLLIQLSYTKTEDDEYDGAPEHNGILCYNSAEYIAEVINFINKEPEMAFCRDYEGFDFNTHIVTKKHCVNTYNKWKTEYDNENKAKEEVRIKTLQFIKDEAIPMLKKYANDVYILDDGKCSSPRYELTAVNTTTDLRDGCYWFFNKTEERILHSKFSKLKKECREIFKKYKTSFYDYTDMPWADCNANLEIRSKKILKQVLKNRIKLVDNGIEVYQLSLK